MIFTNYKNFKDKTLRFFFKKNEKTKNLIKFLTQNYELKVIKKANLLDILFNLKITSSITRIRNRCVFSGRGRSVISKFRLSRHMFKQLATRGHLTNVKKIF